jgi:AcrR family transcriptional regulator
MEAIAVRAAIGRATLYRRWPNKTALLRFCADQLADVSEPADTGDLRKDLLTVFEPLAELSYGDGPLALLTPTFIAEAAHDGQMRMFLADNVVSHRSGALAALRRARQRGELRPGVNINLTVEMIAGALSDRAYLLGKPVTSAYVRSVIDQAIAGMVAERDS